ncbi:PP0621 family protein [Simplicispira psychrophila]|uniref:PP0621 family protein n=1 Tax=Simplicispira psychrophila TaxID=80882 RepID=UPI000481C8DD|nr:PP0621 family protein [Simplicispira psychrophila]
MKYLVLFLVLALVYAVWRSQNRPSAPPPRARPPLPAPQDMVACQRCGLHLPRSEAVGSGQRHYCCAEHQRSDA